MKQVVIGIICKQKKEDEKFSNTYVRDELKQAIFDNGGLAIGLIPPAMTKIKATNDWCDILSEEEKENIIKVIKMCDGIILQGGNFSSLYECFVAKYCYEEDIPILGICAGKNNLVRAVGGKIKRLDNPEVHKSLDEYVHKIEIVPDSLLFKIIQKKSIWVNSRHQCYTENCGILKASAYGEGVVEAVESPHHKFYLAVQFHPESLYQKDENMNKIFKYFINVCQNK